MNITWRRYSGRMYGCEIHIERVLHVHSNPVWEWCVSGPQGECIKDFVSYRSEPVSTALIDEHNALLSATTAAEQAAKKIFDNLHPGSATLNKVLREIS